MVSYRFRTKIVGMGSAGNDSNNVLLKELAKQSSNSGAVKSHMATKAAGVAAGAKRALGNANTASPSQNLEREQVRNAISIVQTKSKYSRRSIYPDTQITVFLVVSPHPAADRWEFGTRRTPATNHLRVGLVEMGGN